MKYVYMFLASLMLVGISAFPFNLKDYDELNELDNDILDFYSLVPEKELERVLIEHSYDPELEKAINYLLSDDLHKLVYAAEDLHQFHRYVYYLQKAGYNAIEELRDTHEILGMKEYIPPKNMTKKVTTTMKEGGGFNGLVDDLIAILPKKEIEALRAKKLKESPAYAKFNAALLSPTFAEIRTQLYAQKPMQSLVQGTKANGIDLLKFYSFRYQLIGFSL